MDSGGSRIEKKKTVKRQIRDTRRLLSREDLPETVRQTKERMLTSLQQELTYKETHKRSRKIAKKYRMVKFFERRKISRRLKSKLKEFSMSKDAQERSTLLDELYVIRKELNYVVNYPEEEKYLALYPSTETTSAKANSRKKKLLEEIMAKVERRELPDAAETESNWSSVVTTDLPSHGRDFQEVATSQSTGDSDRDGSDRMYFSDTRLRIKGDTSKTKSELQCETRKPPAQEESTSEREVIAQTKECLKEDDFFLMT